VAMGVIQYNSSPEHDLINGGFIANGRADERPANPDFRVLVTVGFDKVTDQVLAQARGKTGRAYFDAVDAASKQIVAECEKDGSVRCSVANMYYGTDFYRIAQLELSDVRLVYAPPRAIGNYGDEIDNFMWPRHTGDFTLLRAYPDQKNDGLSLALEFSRPLVGTQDFDKLVRFEEKVGTEDSSWTLSDDGLTLRYPFVEAGKEFSLVVSPDLLAADGSAFRVHHRGQALGDVQWSLLGRHNVLNGLAALAAAHAVGVAPAEVIPALARFRSVKRRMEVIGSHDGITVYDDFAHHPTAIATTLEGLRAKVGDARIVVAMEPRSNSMRLGAHAQALAPSLALADEVVFLHRPELAWDAAAVIAAVRGEAHAVPDTDALLAQLQASARSGDHVVFMSNGGFDGAPRRFLAALQAR